MATGHWLRARARLVGGAALAGVAAGAVALVLLVALSGDVAGAVSTSAGFGAVVTGFGMLSWSGAVMMGDGYEAMQAHMDIDSNWTERRGRRAMARVSGFGGGWLGTALLVSAVLGV
jgi:hypothetical protein